MSTRIESKRVRTTYQFIKSRTRQSVSTLARRVSSLIVAKLARLVASIASRA